MKYYNKKVAILGFLFIIALNASAQKGEIGFRLMPSISSLDFKSTSGGNIQGNAQIGFGLGGFIGFNFTNHVGVQVEAIYNSISQKFMDSNVEHNVKLKYFNIPLLLSLNSGKNSLVNLNIVAGPQLGLNIGGSIKSTGGDSTNMVQAVLLVKKGDLGFAYGAGIDFALNPSKLMRFGLGFRGVYGLIDISDNNNNNTSNSYYIIDRAHLKTYSGYVGLSFLL